jgi:hypothetical protein
MADGGVSTAVRSVYPGNQARTLLFEVLQEAEKPAGKVMRRAQSFAGMRSNRVDDVDPSVMARVETSPQLIKGERLSIKGDLYVIKGIFGRLVYLRCRQEYEA